MSATVAPRRAAQFTVLLLLVALVGDGFSGRPGPFVHQLIVVPFSVLFLGYIFMLLGPQKRVMAGRNIWTVRRALVLAAFLEFGSICLFAYEAHHFSAMGYHVTRLDWWVLSAILAAVLILFCSLRRTAGRVVTLAVALYGCGLLLAIVCFPLNYLRSDMLPVIAWADTSLLHRMNPYQTMYIGGRTYDFPYLPGMLLAYFPAVWARLDLRFLSLAYLDGMVMLLMYSARKRYRMEVAALLACFLLSPFLQFRHDLYLEPHWFAMLAAFVLLGRGRFAWGIFVFGISMGIYQFSWIIFPFLVLYGWRRGGWREATKAVLTGAGGMLLIVGPFLRSASRHIASNTVGQWGTFGHAIADPMNLSYWLTYVVAPADLLRVQAALMVAIFMAAVLLNRCRTLADTMRWSIGALVLFVMTNSIVDGYFYLMLLVPLLFFTCLENDWIAPPASDIAMRERELAPA